MPGPRPGVTLIASVGENYSPPVLCQGLCMCTPLTYGRGVGKTGTWQFNTGEKAFSLSANHQTLRLLSKSLSVHTESGREGAFRAFWQSGASVREANFSLAKTDIDAFYAIEILSFYQILSHLGVPSCEEVRKTFPFHRYIFMLFLQMLIQHYSSRHCLSTL